MNDYWQAYCSGAVAGVASSAMFNGDWKGALGVGVIAIVFFLSDQDLWRRRK